MLLGKAFQEAHLQRLQVQGLHAISERLHPAQGLIPDRCGQGLGADAHEAAVHIAGCPPDVCSIFRVPGHAFLIRRGRRILGNEPVRPADFVLLPQGLVHAPGLHAPAHTVMQLAGER